MFDPALFNEDDPDFDSVQFERSAQRAITDLQRIVGTLAHRCLVSHRRARSAANCALSWRALLEIEEQAFSDLGFQSRHDKAIVDGLLRLRDSRLPGPNIDEAVDWRRDDEQLPAVYVIVRALVEAQSKAGSEA
jgi:Protein of unknown function (DUF2471)